MTRPTQNSKFIIQNSALASLLLLYLVVALVHAYLAPLTTGPDELAHYEYVRFIAEQGRLPLNRQERGQASYKSDQPPLYHLLTALPAGLVDPTGPPYLKRVSDHPRRQLIERTRHAWGLYNTEDEQWPYRAEVLRWQVGRWVAIFFGAATVAITYFIAREVFTGSRGAGEQGRGGEIFRSPLPLHAPAPLLALAAAAIVGFIPRFVLTGSMLNYETTLAFFAALFLWVLVRMANESMGKSANQQISELRHPTAPHASRLTYHVSPITLYAALLGLFLGFAITTKLSALILPLETLVALWLIKRYAGWSWTMWLRTVAITGGTALLAVSWWFGFILYQFNTVAQDGLWVGLLRPLIAADASDATTNRLLSFLTGGQAGFAGAIENLDSGPPWAWLATLFRTFWVVGIEGVQPLGLFGLLIALAWCLLAAYGLFIVWRQNDRRPPTADRRDQHLYSPTSNLQYPKGTSSPTSNTQRALRLQSPISQSRLTLSLLLLHLAAAFVLPLIRYAATFSLADTAQGRHILFLTAPALAILLVWGVSVVAGGRWQVAGGRSPEAGRRVAGAQVAGDRTDVSGARSSLLAPRSPLSAPCLTPLLPGLFLLLWSLVQLWTMSWAYLPLLPVSTLPEAKAQAVHQLDQPLNDYVTLAGYTVQRDRQMLRLDLIWQATAVSPADYLTEVSLLDSRDNLIRQWVGYPAGGRYPTRAWDEGDTVRDTVWLPPVGLEPGQYQIQLSLRANTVYPPPDPGPWPVESPLTLTSITVQDSPEPAVADYQIWQNGRVLTGPKNFRYRETILVTLHPNLARQPRQVQIVAADPGTTLFFEPERDLGDSLVFVVGPDWSSGAYRLQIRLEETGQQLASEPLVRVIDRWQRQFTPPEIRHPLEANFANRVLLLGYDLGSNRAEPGGGLPVTLYWQGLDWLGEDYTIFTRLLAADQTSHGGRDRLPREGYRTLYWAPGEIIIDPFGVPVDADAPGGVYYLNVGLYKQVEGQAISMPLVQDGQPIETTSVSIGPIKIGQAAPEWTLDTAAPQFPLSQPFGETPNLTLLGYDLKDQASQPLPHPTSHISPLNLTLYWRSESPLPIDYTTFVHLRNEAGAVVAQKDQLPLNGAYPTSLWDPGEIIADEVIVSLPPELPPGDYSLVVGLYDFNTGARLAVLGHANNDFTLTTLELLPE